MLVSNLQSALRSISAGPASVLEESLPIGLDGQASELEGTSPAASQPGPASSPGPGSSIGPGLSIGPARGSGSVSTEQELILRLLEGYGANRALILGKAARIADQCQAFIQRFGDGPVRVLRAPARINILGEHVDYVSYIPTASLTFGSREHDMVIMFRPLPGGLVRCASTDTRFSD